MGKHYADEKGMSKISLPQVRALSSAILRFGFFRAYLAARRPRSAKWLRHPRPECWRVAIPVSQPELFARREFPENQRLKPLCGAWKPSCSWAFRKAP